MPRFYTDDLTPITYMDTGGPKPPLVFIHGWTSSAADWRAIMLSLRRSYRCIAIDLRGHGLTPSRPPLTIERLAQDVHQLLEYTQVHNPMLIGWSMGGLVTFEYLKQFGYDHLRGVVLVDQTPRMRTDDQWNLGLFGHYTAEHVDLLQVLFDTNERRVLRRFAMGIFHPKRRLLRFTMWLTSTLRARYDTKALIALAKDMAQCDYCELLPQINLPVLLCYGTASWLYPGAVGEYLCDKFPQSTLVKFDHSGHCPPIEEPLKFARVLREFSQQTYVAPRQLRSHAHGEHTIS